MGIRGDSSSESDATVELVATKLIAPASPPGLLPRPELVERLVAGRGTLSLISAPAGWGKSSLLAAWSTTEAEKRPFAFLRLDPTDNDCQTFWTYLIAALRSIRPEIMAEADAVLRTPGVMPLRSVVPSLVNEMSHSNTPIVLVLDDYHVITHADVQRSVLYLIDHLPPTLHLAIATRADPPFPLGRLRASGIMTEIRSRDLAFAENEAAQFANEQFDLGLDDHSVHLLCRRTEGWPAAVHLASLSLQGEPDRRGFVERFAGDDRNITDYLTTEVLQQLPPERREFLLRTSVLENLTGSLCDAVVESTDSTNVLEELERLNLFLIPLDSHRRWYRYHHLFGEWLRHELNRSDPAVIPTLHDRATRWFAENGSPMQAISHSIAAGRHERAVTLMNRYLTKWDEVHWPSVRRWLQEIPEDIQRLHPMVSVAQMAIAASCGDAATGLRWLQAAEAAVDQCPDDLRPTIETTVALFNAINEVAQGDLETALDVCTSVANKERPSASSNHAIAIGLVGTITFWTKGALEAIPALREGSLARQQLSLVDGGLTATLAAAYAEIGDWSAAEATARAALSIPSPSQHYRLPDAMGAHYALGRVLLSRGEHDQAAAEIRQGLDLARGWVETIFVAYGCLALADATRDYTERRALVREARQLISEGRAQG